MTVVVIVVEGRERGMVQKEDHVVVEAKWVVGWLVCVVGVD